MGQRKKSLIPHEELNLWILHSDDLPSSHRDCMVIRAYYKVLMTHVPHTVRISNVMFVNRIREMTSFAESNLRPSDSMLPMYYH